MACREGLSLASDLLLREVRIASDCANAVRNIHGEAMCSYGHIIQEIKSQGWTFQKNKFCA
jgi:hypothetical protein